MSGTRSTVMARQSLAVALLALTVSACSSLAPTGPRPRPSTVSRPAPTTSSPSPAATPPTGAASPSVSAPPPSVGSATAPRTQSVTSGVSGELLAQSRTERAAGSLPEATALIERALRLDPNNPELWVERGELALQTGNASQASVMARKALTLVSANTAVAARAQRLLQAAGAR